MYKSKIETIADTARNLCKYNCLYMSHTKFNNFPNDHYTVRCNLDKSYYNGIIHLVRVDQAGRGNN